MHTIDYLIEERWKREPEGIPFYRNTNNSEVPVTTKEFCESKRAFACALEKNGVKRGSVVGILSSVRYEWELAEKSALSLGAAVFGIDTRHTAAEIAGEIAAGSIETIVVENESLLAQVPESFTGLRILIDTPPATSSTLCMDTLLREHTGMSPTQRAHPDDFAVIVSTSGSTGTPKLIRFRNKQIVAGCFAIMETLDLKATDESDNVTLSWLPLVYMTGRIMNLVSYVSRSKIYFLNNPKEITNALTRISPTHFIAVPIFYERVYKGILDEVAKLSLFKQIAFQSIIFLRKHTQLPIGERVIRTIRHKIFGTRMQYCISGSAPLSTEINKFFGALGLQVLEAYALSESALPVAMNTPRNCRIGSVGKVVKGNTCILAEDGEILLGGAGIFEGYIGHESENSEHFTKEGHLKTGDIGKFDADGFLYLIGRKKTIIKTANGYRISPIEVESAYEPSVYIKQIMVVGDRQKFLGALIVLDMEHIETYLASKNISARGKAASKHEATRELITEELKKHGKDLAIYKQVACFHLLSEPFSVEKGELTGNFKLRRDTIMQHYQKEIHGMFRNS